MLVGKPAILMPSPNVAEDHQTHNAMALSTKGAALLIKDDEAKDKLINSLEVMIENVDARKKMSKALKELGKKDAAQQIAKAVLELIKTNK